MVPPKLASPDEGIQAVSLVSPLGSPKRTPDPTTAPPQPSSLSLPQVRQLQTSSWSGPTLGVPFSSPLSPIPSPSSSPINPLSSTLRIYPEFAYSLPPPSLPATLTSQDYCHGSFACLSSSALATPHPHAPQSILDTEARGSCLEQWRPAHTGEKLRCQAHPYSP